MIKYVKIDGIHCDTCKKKIISKFKENKQVKKATIENNILELEYVKDFSNKKIIKLITDLGYYTTDKYITKTKVSNNSIKEFIIILVTILLLCFILKKIFGFNIFNMIPTINTKMTYIMVFITGILTSLHCISMCGAINLIATYKTNKIKTPILYNLGRIISYTLIGGLAGLIGGFIKINDTLSGIIIILSAILMLLISLNMFGIIKLKSFKLKHHFKNPFIIGLINGLMPCGPLQAMQIYALSTNSFFEGAMLMLVFGLGTFPLMFGFGLLFNNIKGKGKIILSKIAPVIIFVLSITMLVRGLGSLGLNINPYGGYQKSIIKNKYQTVEISLSYNSYENIVVQKDIPVKLIINVKKKYLTGCNNEIVIKEYKIKKKLKVGENIIKFTPTKTGNFTMNCWMNMIKNQIKVVDDKSYFKE